MSSASRLRVGVPLVSGYGGNNVTFTAFQVDASTKGVAWIAQAEEALTITHLGFQYGARTGTPPVYRISLQTPTSAGGVPDGTVLGAGTPASATFTPPADATWDNTFQWVALSNSYACTRGQILAVCVEYSSGTIDASNRSSFVTSFATAVGTGETTNLFPYSATETTSAWTKAQNFPIYGLRTASGRYGIPVQAAYATNTAGTNGHRQAMCFTLPAGWGNTFKVAGARMHGRCSAGTGQTFKFALWDATTELQAVTFDSDILGASPANPRGIELLFQDTTLSTLSFGTKYFIGLEVTSSSAVGIRGFQFASSNDAAALNGGANFYLANNTGSWSEDQTVRPCVELILDDWTEPTGSSGGMIVHPGMSGRLV